MINSTLDNHVFDHGLSKPPILQSVFSDLIQLTSYEKERMPNYIWVGLLRCSTTRENFFREMMYVNCYIEKNIDEDINTFSSILKLDRIKKIELLKCIKTHFGEYVLDPLNVVSHFDEDLREVFYDKMWTNNDRIMILNETIKKLSNKESEEAMDLRYMMIFLNRKHICISEKECPILIQALNMYPSTRLDDPIMGTYKAEISSLEVSLMGIVNDDYYKYFYEEMYLMTDCNPYALKLPIGENREHLKNKLNEFRMVVLSLEDIYNDEKKDVVLGNLTYAYKIINEIYNSNLENSIISRFAIRTILEIYINLKYMFLREKDDENVWNTFIDYGCGKYKLIYKKIVEEKAKPFEGAHLNADILKCIANENKNEEFLSIDFRNFLDKKMKDKFNELGENDLYEIYYEYGSNYTHAFWGAIRESAMLVCANPLHKSHFVPDLNNEQNLLDISNDIIVIIDKLIRLIDGEMNAID